MNIEDKKYALFLCSVPWLGKKSIEKLLDTFNDYQHIYEAEEERLKSVLSPGKFKAFIDTRSSWILDLKYQELEKSNIKFATIEDEEYPQRLRDIPDAPYGIFYKGEMVRDDCVSVAVIGARDCSEYGRYVASGLGKRLGECGIQVISGMARGIDGISQKEAIEAGGSSFAVLGSGVDICYPEQNRFIYDKLIKSGGIISEYPPGTPAMPRNFPPRNRIVSGLADVVVVVEARQKSGTLITVDMALEQGKDVYVVPGRVTDRLSDGCNKLIKQGAGIFLSPEDFVNEITENFTNITTMKNTTKTTIKTTIKTSVKTGISLDIRQTAIYESLSSELKTAAEVLDFTPKDIDTIYAAMCKSDKTNTYKTLNEISSILMQLTLKGVAVQLTPGYFVLKSDTLFT